MISVCRVFLRRITYPTSRLRSRGSTAVPYGAGCSGSAGPVVALIGAVVFDQVVQLEIVSGGLAAISSSNGLQLTVGWM